ncbi:MAG: LptF/LptG family permease [Pseudomonadota bacterium]
MTQLDRYILRQIGLAFGFFCFVLAGVIWLTQAVVLIDVVLSAGQSIVRLFELSLLILPRVLGMVVPLSAFAATLFAINKLYSEAELVVMMMAGQGPLALARPVALFATVIAIATLIFTNFLAPRGELELERTRQALRAEFANALIREGRFLYPVDGLTVFIRDVGNNGQMEGLFLHDERDPSQPVTYTAERARFIRVGDEARLVMSRGVALSYVSRDQMLARVQFDQFTYDLTEFVNQEPRDPFKASTLPTWRLVAPDEGTRALPRFREGSFIATGHERLVFGVHAFLVPLIGLAIMLTGSYQRRGFGMRIVFAVLAVTALIVAGLVAKSAVISIPAIWPISYVPAMIAAVLTAFLFRRAMGPLGRVRSA